MRKCISCGNVLELTLEYFPFDDTVDDWSKRCWHCAEGLGRGEHLPDGPEAGEDACFCCELPECDEEDERCLIAN